MRSLVLPPGGRVSEGSPAVGNDGQARGGSRKELPALIYSYNDLYILDILYVV